MVAGRGSATVSGMRLLRRIGIALAGGTVLLVGIVMIVLPGPAILVIPAGLAILAVEFVWARKVLHKIRELTGQKKKPELKLPR
jgi:tellurite resistance protein TerC